MNNRFRKALSALLAAAMLLSLLPASAMAVDAEDTPDAAPADVQEVSVQPESSPAAPEDTPDASPEDDPIDDAASLAYTVFQGVMAESDIMWDFDPMYHRLTVKGTGEMPGYDSASSYPWYAYRSEIEEIDIQGGVLSIGAYAFENYRNISVARMPEGLSQIGEAAFSGCIDLMTVYIPGSVIRICKNAFNNTALMHGSVVFGGTEQFWNARVGDTTNFDIGNDPLVNCPDIWYEAIFTTSGTIGENITWKYDDVSGSLLIEGTGAMPDYGYGSSYPWKALYREVSYIIVEEGVTSIGGGAFEYFSNVESVSLPEGLTDIGMRAFYQNYALDQLYLPASLQRVGAAAFFNDDNLQSGYVSYAGTASDWAAVQIDYSNGALTGCENFSFGDCGTCGDNLSWSFRDGFLTITGTGDMRDYGPDGSANQAPWAGLRDQVRGIEMPEGLTSIGAYAFANMPLYYLEIPETVVSIGSMAFSQGDYDNEDDVCATYESVYLPGGLTTIGEYAFEYCRNLTSVTMGTSVTSIGACAFYLSGLNGGDIYYLGDPNQFVQIQKGRLELDPDGEEMGWWDDDDGWAYSTVHYTYSGVCGHTEGYFAMTANLQWELDWYGTLTITGSGRMDSWSTNGALCYAPWAHYYVRGSYQDLRPMITSVSLPDGLENIGDSAFNGLNITSIVIPDSVTEIGRYAFYGCKALESIDLRHVTKIGYTGGLNNSCVFEYCTSLKEIYLGAGLTAIAGEYSFDNCGALNIYYDGSEEMWNQVAVDSTLPEGSNVYWKYITGGQCGDNAYWGMALNEDNVWELTIWGTGAMYDNNAPWKSYDAPYYSIVICEGITHVGASAFEAQNGPGGMSYEDQDYPREATLPSTLESIGAQAFRLCDELEEIVIPGNVTSIGAYAFNGTGLTRVVFNGTQADWDAMECPENVFYNINNGGTIGNGIELVIALSGSCGDNLTWNAVQTGVYEYHSYWQDIVYPLYTVTVSGTGDMDDYYFDFGEYEWDDMPPWAGLAIEAIVLEEGVTSVGHYAFYGFSDVTSISLPSTLEKIGTYAFYECHDIDSIVLPSSVQDIRDYAFLEFGPEFTVYYSGTEAQWEAVPFVGNHPFTDMDWRDARIVFLPEIIQPTPVSANAGAKAAFTVGVENGYSASYQWQYMAPAGTKWASTTLTGNKTDTLTVSATAGRDGYLYRCKITLGDGRVIYTEPAVLTVVSLAITGQPQNVSTTADKSAKFTVAATGSALTYQWQYKAPAGTKWASTSMTGSKTATLSVPATAGRDGYQYRCVVTSGTASVTSEPAVLRVLTVKDQPASVSAAVGDTAKFTVSATGDVAAYQWQYMAPAGTKWASTSMTGSKTATLSVPATAGRDGYSYRCKITDTAGNIVYSEPAVLTVAPAVAITAQPADVTASAGTTAKFTVAATGSNLTYQWQYKAPAGTKWASTSMTGNKTATLSVPATAGRDGYQYRCVITSGTVSVTSEPAVLTVFTAPAVTITAQPQSVCTVSGTTAKFTVAATGSDLTYQWQYKAPGGTKWVNTTLTGNKTATLSVAASAGRDGYQYQCVITSGTATVTSEPASLRVLTVKVQPADVTAAAGTTAKFTVAATGDVASYQWEYKSATGTKWTATTLTGNKTATLSVGASAGRNGYSYRCTITDTAGNTVTSGAAVLTVG